MCTGAVRAAPLVSVVMPAFNAERYIGDAIESILAQTFGDFELIIVNDGSTDGTRATVERYARRDERIYVKSLERNSGGGHARNVAILHARGPLIAVMDADDLSLPERLEKQVRFLQAHPEVGVVGSNIVYMDEHAMPIWERRYWSEDAAIRKYMFLACPLSIGSCMIRKDVIARAGLHDATYQHAEDYELFFRLGRVTQFANIGETLYRYRVHPHSTSFRYARDQARTTIRIRAQFFEEYHATWWDRCYHALDIFALYCMPSGVKWYVISLLMRLRFFNRFVGESPGRARSGLPTRSFQPDARHASS